MSNEEAALSVQGLTAGYGGPPIIDQVSLAARRGAISRISGRRCSSCATSTTA